MILDTCALLWLATGSKKLSHATLKKINEAPAVYVSAISGFEIAIKVARGKLKLPHRPGEWFDKVAGHHGLAVLPLELEICIAAADLPPVHDDPCDRFIIATAQLNKLPVVTADERFEKYGLAVLC
jgi:PIN domain nuclease of toxin-antitoxin system